MTDFTPPPSRPVPFAADPLARAASLLRTAAGLFNEGAEPDMDDVGELVRTAQERLTAWTDNLTASDDGAPAFDALDACAAVLALIDAGLDPRNGKTISPIHGVLLMAAQRLEVAPVSARKPASAAQAPRNRSRLAAAPKADDPATWPIVWRVTAPGAGSFNHDMVFIETEDEAEARDSLRELREGGWPVRLERVACGPLPGDAREKLPALRGENPQNPDAEPREVMGRWEVPPAA